MKRKMICCAWIVEIVLLFSCIVSLVKPLDKYEYTENELIAPKAIFLEQFMGEDRNGYYIDNTLRTEGEGLEEYTIAIPATDLKKGSYEVKIKYKTGTNECVYTTDSESRFSHLKIGRQDVGLKPDEQERIFTIESDVDVWGYSVKVKFPGYDYIFVDEISIYETISWRVKHLITVFSLVLIINSLWWIGRKNPDGFRKELAKGVLLGATMVLASQPVFSSYLYDGHDLGFHLNRIEGIKESLQAGIFPVRMHFNSLGGAGYPVSVFYGDVLLYIPAMLRILGWSVQSAYQIYVVMINVLSTLIMYKALKSIFKDEWIGMAGTFIYIMAPYRLECIYLRAAVGEYTALCFYPVIVYALYKIYGRDKEKYSWVYLSIGFSGLIFSHIISTFCAFLLTAIFCIVRFRDTFKKNVLFELIKAVLLTLGICAGFLIPFADYMLSDVMPDGRILPGTFVQHAATLSQLLSIFPHGSGVSVRVHEEQIYQVREMPFSIGGAAVAGIVLFLFYYFYLENNKRDRIVKFGNQVFVFSILAICMATSYFPWNVWEQLGDVCVYIMYYIQFPWRFLGSATVLVSMVVCVVIYWAKSEKDKGYYYAVVSFFIILTYISGNHFMTDYMMNTEKNYIVDARDVNRHEIGAGEYLPDNALRDYHDNILFESETVAVISAKREEEIYYVECANLTKEEQAIQLPIINYDNYCAKDIVTGENLNIESGEECRIKIVLPEGYCGKIAVEYHSPWYWRLGEMISLITLVGMLVIFFRMNGKRLICVPIATKNVETKCRKE